MARASVLIWGSAVRVCSPMAMVTVRSGRRVRASFLIVTSVASWRWRTTARAANTGQVRFDGVALVVEHGPSSQVALGQPERLLDPPPIVIGRDDRRAVHRRGGRVGDVALQAGELAGAFDECPVDALGPVLSRYRSGCNPAHSGSLRH
jgi:hypothetical protein